jgi:hypothetical protein
VKRLVGNVVATIAALLVAALTVVASLRYLKEPQDIKTWVGLLDWAVLLFSAMTTGVITFITAWGHFQEEPMVGSGEAR